MNLQEIEAEIARAHHEGAKEISALVSSMTKLGLSLAAVAGALEEHFAWQRRHPPAWSR